MKNFVFTRVCASRDSLTGFTLVEIIVVMIIITILVLITVPNVVRSRISANEFAAIANLRSLYNALQMYYTNNRFYPEKMTDLISTDSTASYTSKELASGNKSGYLFKYSYVDKNTFSIIANPEYPGKTGKRYFYINDTGLIRQNAEDEANENSPPVE